LETQARSTANAPPLSLENSVKPLRIALLGYRSNPFSGGQGVYLKYLSKALIQLGHQVDVISGQPYPDLDPGVQLIKLPGLNLYEHKQPSKALSFRQFFKPADVLEWLSFLSGGFPEPYAFGRRLVDHLRTQRPEYDIIHDNQSLCSGLLDSEKLGYTVVTTIHHPITFDRDIALANTPDWGMRLLVRRWYNFLNMQISVARKIKHIVTVSENSKIDIAGDFGVHPSRLTVVYNGIDTATFRPLPEIPRLPFHLITTASADQPLKGTQHLIPAIAQLVDEFPNLRLTFIGAPKPGGKTQRSIKALGLEDRIEFLHGISTQRIVELYASASIAIVPSEYEGFGFPAGEAMACGVPVVSSDGGALPEVVGDAGIIVPSKNPEALAAGIRSLLLDQPRCNALSLAGRARILAHFNWSTVAIQMTDFYAKAMRS
jgi:glycosyltransferase involved in cell wall biosynthesis|tara:strand:+ start:58 stop:1347 length:1290 start_codon:yes stop_codon:yes gene_type:complete